MKKTTFILAVLAVFILAVGSAEAMDKAALEAKIKTIASYLEKPEGPGSEAKTMFTLLIESVLQAAPESGFPPEFTENMKKAKEIFDSTSIFNPDGVVYLHKAYRLVNAGQDFQTPASVKEIPDAVNYIKMLLATAIKNLKVDKIGDCVRNLLETAVMIVTPKIRDN